MSISWDENQLPALISWIESQLPLQQGELAVLSMDIPENCFAGQVDLEEKEFQVFTNINSPMTDTTVNVVLAYIVTMAFDKNGWEPAPASEVLFDCHRQVCQTLLEFNEDFSKHVEECWDILEAWHTTHASPDATPTTTTAPATDSESLVEEMGASLFRLNPADSKGYVN